MSALAKSEEPPCPQNVRTGQIPLPSDCGRLLWTAPYQVSEHRASGRNFVWGYEMWVLQKKALYCYWTWWFAQKSVCL